MTGDGQREHSQATTGRRVRWGSVLWMLLVLTCGVSIVWLRWQAARLDYAEVNVMTLILTFILLLAILARLCVWRGASRTVRWLPVVAVAALTAAAAGSLRVDRVSGRLVPQFSWRWAPKPDRLLAFPSVTADAPEIDLRTTTSADFPQFLGPRRDLTVSHVTLHRDWQSRPPRLVWRQPIGAGWSGFSVVNGYAVTLEQRGEDELVTCYDVTSGKACWTHSVVARHQTVLGGVGPRSTPTIDQGLVYALGATGVLRCLDGGTGQLVWRDELLRRCGVNLEEDLQAVAWGRAASPLVVDDLLIVPLGGPAGGPYTSLIALDKRTGDLRWQGGASQVSYASPSLMTLASTRQIVIVNESSVSGHRVEDGVELWSHPWPGGSTSSASVSQAVAVSPSQLLLSKGYGIGSALIEVRHGSDDTWATRTLWEQTGLLKTKFTNVAVRDGYAYGLSDGILECVDISAGRRCWKERRGGNFGHGQILLVDDLLLVSAEDGTVALVEANPDRFVKLSEFAALSDQTWNTMCLAGPYLLVRNAVEAACYELPLQAGAP